MEHSGESKSKIRIMVVDDHPLVRDALKSLILREEDFALTGEAEDFDSALAALPAADPDVVVVDISLPGRRNGIVLSREILKARPESKVLFLSMHDDSEFVLRAIKAGGLGYVVKSSGTGEIPQAIREVMAGRRYVSSSLASRSLNDRIETADEGALTDRELEVLEWIAKGLSSREIADKLEISPRTVETHRMNVMRKLEVKNIAELVKQAMELGLIA